MERSADTIQTKGPQNCETERVAKTAKIAEGGLKIAAKRGLERATDEAFSTLVEAVKKLLELL